MVFLVDVLNIAVYKQSTTAQSGTSVTYIVIIKNYQWPLAGGTPTTLYSIWTYDNDRNLKYWTKLL